MTIEKKFLNKKESCEILNCSEKELEKISVAGFLKKYKIGRLIRYRINDLRYFLKYQDERMR